MVFFVWHGPAPDPSPVCHIFFFEGFPKVEFEYNVSNCRISSKISKEERFSFVRASSAWIKGKDIVDACFVLNFGYSDQLPWPQVNYKCFKHSKRLVVCLFVYFRWFENLTAMKTKLMITILILEHMGWMPLAPAQLSSLQVLWPNFCTWVLECSFQILTPALVLVTLAFCQQGLGHQPL